MRWRLKSTWKVDKLYTQFQYPLIFSMIYFRFIHFPPWKIGTRSIGNDCAGGSVWMQMMKKVKIYAREIHQDDDDDDRVSRAQSISSCTKYTQSLEASSIKCSIFEWFGAFVVFYTFIALLSSRLVCDLPLISCIWFYLSCYHEGFAS